jgi:hypothetical protein
VPAPGTLQVDRGGVVMAELGIGEAAVAQLAAASGSR